LITCKNEHFCPESELKNGCWNAKTGRASLASKDQRHGIMAARAAAVDFGGDPRPDPSLPNRNYSEKEQERRKESGVDVEAGRVAKILR
jgi:hypothetical protein